jgi:hypothetical protein
MSHQYVYIFSNELYPDDLLKIGWTKCHPSLRARDLQTAGVPAPFTVEYVIITSNGRNLEKEIHSYLDEFRLSQNRKFFKINKSYLHEILTNNMNLNLMTIYDIGPYLTDDNTSVTIPRIRTEVGFPCQRSDNQVVSDFLEKTFEPCEPKPYDRLHKGIVAMRFAQWCENEYGKKYTNKIQIVFDAMTEKYGELYDYPSPGWDRVKEIRIDPMLLFPIYFSCECGMIYKSRQGHKDHRSICSVYQKMTLYQLRETISEFIDDTFEPCEPNPHRRLNKGVVMGLFSDWYKKWFLEKPGDKFLKVFDAMTEKYGEPNGYPSPGWEGVRVRVNDSD